VTDRNLKDCQSNIACFLEISDELILDPADDPNAKGE
jgi:hypothetical protein